jgi:microfibrillar-associated protein 1
MITIFLVVCICSAIRHLYFLIRQTSVFGVFQRFNDIVRRALTHCKEVGTPPPTARISRCHEGSKSMKRYFSGKPIGEEQRDSSSDEEEEDVVVKKATSVEMSSIDNVEVVGRSAMISHGSSIQASGISKEDHEDTDDQEEDIEEDSGSEDSDDEDSDSDDEPKLLKPLFLSKKQRVQSKPTSSVLSKESSKERTLKNIEMMRQQEIDYLKQLELETQNCGGLDDTDGKDPQKEKAEWELRQLKREKRDREREEKEMEELEELEMRRLRTEEEKEQEAMELAEQQAKGQEGKKEKKISGAFFQDDSILNRKMDGEIEKYDKSLLPQRYKTGNN